MSVADVLNSPVTQCALLVCVLAAMVAVSYWGLRKYRAYIGQDQSQAVDFSTNYRELHEEGVISDAEYRTIKSRLNAAKPREVGGTDRTG